MKIGVALSGGAVPKFACIGVLKALEEEGIQISHIAGTSAGAIVAALYAYGYTPCQIEIQLQQLSNSHIDVDWKGISRRFLFFHRNLDGGVKGEKLQSLIHQLTGDDTFSACQIPCAVSTTDLRSQQTIVISSHLIKDFETLLDMPIDRGVRASASIPIMYQPVRWNDYILIDGGMLKNCPVDIVKGLGAEKVLAIDPISTFSNTEPYDDMSTILNQSMNILLEAQMREDYTKATMCLKPDLGDVGLFDFKQISRCVELGYSHTKERMDNLIETFSC
ncbi:NTE family protein [Salinibacillus kushneri]|uniref:NTE family protein n=1 Tax=Salinibacillus kushneri TaxID=237682 RepID=A0A1I0IN82_9BACI|nr:patatin-like phospholipase family protein [Salinibacillus kushneri]SET98300.1 NTE family protein [Salinibacillus kushneri]